ncbi:MAG TPA: DNA-binding transcriptional regulator, partial [Polyangiaceae bacterium]|jgi:LacI family transcriptional regulator|nr:DNA-binding transcriptional regulator [Polyangiaceae bacterium]
MREHRPWSIHFDTPERAAREWIADFHGDGIIARLGSREAVQAMIKTGLPVVDILGGGHGLARIPFVHIDDLAIGRMAAEHLLERGFRTFGFFGIRDSNWSDARLAGFSERLAEQGGRVHALKHYWEEYPWDDEQRVIAEWVRDLPKPIGVLVCHDPTGQMLLEACSRIGVNVPDDLAVISVDNDEPYCEISNPALTSIDPNFFGVGYEAATMLEALMNGESVGQEPRLLAPRGIVARRSTEVLAVDDPHVASAARFIRERACDGIGVDDVVQVVPFSHTVLQQRFKKAFGRSVHEEIVEVRIRRAKQLLVETNLSLALIAERVGINNPEYFGVVFKAKTNQTPAQYRRSVRAAREV